MASLQNSKLRSSQSFDYYDYDYNYPQMQNINRMGQQMRQFNNPRVGKYGSNNLYGGNNLYGANNLYGGYSNTYSQYAGAGYGDYDYAGYSGTPAQSKSQTYGSYSGGYNDCPGIPIALLLVTLLGIGVMGFILYQKIVGAGRRKRDTGFDSWTQLLPDLDTLPIIIYHGRRFLF